MMQNSVKDTPIYNKKA